MISTLRGRVLARQGDSVVVEVGGIGLSVSVPAGLAQSLGGGSEVFLHTSLIVREDAFSLYGFESDAELAVFNILLSVSGVGPKSALGVLNHLTVSQIAQAVANDDDAAFRRVTGIGPKTAKLIVVQLNGKLDGVVPQQAPAANAPAANIEPQLVETLVSLGWNEKIARDAAAHTIEHAAASDRESLSALLRQALANLSPGVRA